MHLPVAAVLFTPDQVLVRGFDAIVGLPSIDEDDYLARNIRLFKAHFGESPSTIAFVWESIVKSNPTELGLVQSDKSETGFWRLLIAIHFLWAYPKNAMILATTTGTSERMVQGEFLWYWVRAIGKLRSQVIIWPAEDYNHPGRYICLTVDGVDFRTYEKSSDDYNVDPKTYTHKHNHGGVKYEIGIDAYLPKVVWTNGPYRGGKPDGEIFKMEGGLREKIPEGKVAVTDRVYKDKKHKDNNDLALPSFGDSSELFRIKSRLRSRHESFNGRLKKYSILYDTFRHDTDNHGFAFDAVLVLVQFAMDHGHPIFDANTERVEIEE